MCLALVMCPVMCVKIHLDVGRVCEEDKRTEGIPFPVDLSFIQLCGRQLKTQLPNINVVESILAARDPSSAVVSVLPSILDAHKEHQLLACAAQKGQLESSSAAQPAFLLLDQLQTAVTPAHCALRI